MIRFLSGKVMECDESGFVINCNGVGYYVYSFDKVYGNCDVHIVTIFNEGFKLYGFVKKEDREFFLKVIKVKGVGPVTALRVVGSNELEDLTLNSILKVPGVGEKTALNIYNTFNSNQNTKIIKVLVELGYEKSLVLNNLKKINLNQKEEKIIQEFIKIT